MAFDDQICQVENKGQADFYWRNNCLTVQFRGMKLKEENSTGTRGKESLERLDPYVVYMYNIILRNVYSIPFIS